MRNNDHEKETKRNGGHGGLLVGAGLLALLFSIPLFYDSAKTRKANSGFESRVYKPALPIEVKHLDGMVLENEYYERFMKIKARVYDGSSEELGDVTPKNLEEAYQEISDLKTSVKLNEEISGEWRDVLIATKKYVALLNKYAEKNPDDAKKFLKEHPLYIDALKYFGISVFRVLDKDIMHLESHKDKSKLETSLIGITDGEKSRLKIYQVNTSPSDQYFDGEKIANKYDTFKNYDNN